MAVLERAPWLEPHDAFEGIGAHELNPRYEHVDGGGYDTKLQFGKTATPALFRAESTFFAAVAPIRFDGADISHHQDDAGPINWPALRSGSWWIATKATQSTGYVDPTFATHRAQMAEQAFTHRIFYHWLSSTTDPIAQAEHLIDTVGPLAQGEGLMIDNEEAGTTVAKTVAFASVLVAHYRRPLIDYTGAYVAGGTIWQSTILRRFGPMHLAAYTTEAKARALPGVNTYPWQAWQYSSNGPVPGVVGRCDMNRIDDRAAFDLACGIGTQPVEDDMAQNYYVVAGANARFIGTPAMVRWTGPGDDKVTAAIATQLAAGNLTQVELTGGPGAFAATFLDPPILPTGDTLYTWTGDEFANAAEIHARRATQGPVGPRGPEGPAGATGPAGEPGTASGSAVTGTFEGRVS